MRINRITSWKRPDQLTMNTLNNEFDTFANEINKNNEVSFATDFGATGNGTTDDAPAIQAAHDLIVSKGTPGVLKLPAGTYKCNTGLNINVAFVSLQGDAAVLDFSSVTTGSALTVYATTAGGFAGQPYYNASKEISGLVITGNSQGASVKGIKFSTSGNGGTMSPSHITIRSCVVNTFGTGLSIEDGGYLLRFISTDVWHTTTCINAPSASDAGEEVSFVGCAFFNSTNGFNLANANSDYTFTGCSFDQMDVSYVVVSEGGANFNNCHFEGRFGTGYSTTTKWVSVPAEGSGSLSFLSFVECLFLVKQAQAGDNLTVAVFGIYGNATVHLFGCNVNLSGNATITGATGVFESTTGVVDLLVQNLYYIGNAGLYGTLSTSCTRWLADYNSTAAVTSKGFVVGTAALATNATSGFLYIPTCAGAPVGTPGVRAGTVALVYDTTDDKLFVYNGSWKGGTNPGVFS